jgi:cytochrome d ubiquinol oxidase subunit I
MPPCPTSTLRPPQFAPTSVSHPVPTVSLAWVLLYFRALQSTGDPNGGATFWVKVFALSFALGVVSGVTMSFQFGTNWPGFMQVVGNIAGPLLAYEVLTAFFLEATFLAIMLFGSTVCPTARTWSPARSSPRARPHRRSGS